MNDVLAAALGVVVGAGGATWIWPRLWSSRRRPGPDAQADPEDLLFAPPELQALKSALQTATADVEALRHLATPSFTVSHKAPPMASSAIVALKTSGEAVVAQAQRLHELIDQFDGFTSHALSNNENLRKTLTQVSAASNRVDVRLGAVAPLFNEAALLSTAVADHLQVLQETSKTAGARAAAAHSEWQGCAGLLSDFSGALEAIQASVVEVQDLANRAKLLSLNAAIVASQSQDHGQGFSVVAEQIKAMAHRTFDAAHTIQTGVDAVHRVQQQVEVLADQQTKTLASGRGEFAALQQLALVALTTNASLRHLLEQRAQAAAQEDSAVSALKEATANLIRELMELNSALRIQGRDTRKAQALIGQLEPAVQTFASASVAQQATATLPDGQRDPALQTCVLWLERHRQETARLQDLAAVLAQAESAVDKLGLPYDQVATMADNN